MPSFVFWNAQRGLRLDRIRQLVDDYEPDFLLVAEGKDPPAAILKRLTGAVKGRYRFVSGSEDNVRVFTPYSSTLVKRLDRVQEEKVVVFRIALPFVEPFLLAAVHLRSRLHLDHPEDLIGYAREAHEEIARHEATTGILRTVVVGDFNMNPYDRGMVSADGFHAFMDRWQVRKPERTANGRSRRKFYNPMWSLMGDLSRGPSASYYRPPGRSGPGWQMFDGVILRPEIIGAFLPDELELIATPPFGTASGIPDKARGSDHFPLRFTLNV